MTREVWLAPAGRPLTEADLEAMPDDGRRYELIDGVLFVSRSPSWAHQAMAFALGHVLREACPPQLRVLPAPFDVRTAVDNVVEPDLLVARYEDLTPKNLPTAPVLAVEILSPSTQLHDRNTKMAHYARIGVACYWLLDPAEPGSVVAYRLEPSGRYVEVGTAAGEQALTLNEPFPVSLAPARLLDELRPRS